MSTSKTPTDAHPVPPAASALDGYRDRVNQALEFWLPKKRHESSRLERAMRYSVLGGGKRVRPLLVYATGTALGVQPSCLDGPAAAVECIHSYSLIHDDLPAMDDDDLRRGRPTCHIAFDEATAVLAGDALQVLAFSILADDTGMGVSAETRLAMISLLAEASGTSGMAGGQAIDLDVQGKEVDTRFLEHMHSLKTGALIRASVLLGGLAASPLSDADRHALAGYGAAIGLAFQICDDILDEEGDLELLGKRPGQDQAKSKPTYPRVAGLAGARERADQLHARAMAALEGFSGEAAGLRAMSAYLLRRSH